MCTSTEHARSAYRSTWSHAWSGHWSSHDGIRSLWATKSVGTASYCSGEAFPSSLWRHVAQTALMFGSKGIHLRAWAGSITLPGIAVTTDSYTAELRSVDAHVYRCAHTSNTMYVFAARSEAIADQMYAAAQLMQQYSAVICASCADDSSSRPRLQTSHV